MARDGLSGTAKPWPFRSPGLEGPDERGSGSVLALMLIGILCLLLGTAVVVAGLRVSRETAQTAADLSALAAADSARGLAPGEPCEVASRVASAQGARLVRCEVSGHVVSIATTAGRPPVTRSARAGPPSAAP